MPGRSVDRQRCGQDVARACVHVDAMQALARPRARVPRPAVSTLPYTFVRTRKNTRRSRVWPTAERARAGANGV